MVLDAEDDVVARFAGIATKVIWQPLDDGEYVVVLLVTDDDGALTDSLRALETSPVVTVVNRRPLVLLDETTAPMYGTVVQAPTTLAVGVDVGDPDGQVVTIEWFDGPTDITLAEGRSVTIPVTEERAMAIRVLVTDDDGDIAETWLNITINQPPVAAFQVTLDGVALEGVKVHPRKMLSLDASNSTDPGGIARYQWDFGDGLLQEGILASHAYDAPGDFTIILKVTDDHGASDQVTFLVTVVDEPTPDTSGLDGSTLALLIGLVVAVVILVSLVMLKRLRDEEDEGGTGD